MRSSEGVIEKRGRNRFRSRITIRGRAHSKTFSQLAQAEQWLLDLQLSTDSKPIAQPHREGYPANRVDQRCRAAKADHRCPHSWTLQCRALRVEAPKYPPYIPQ